jgi:hypothetical protein
MGRKQSWHNRCAASVFFFGRDCSVSRTSVSVASVLAGSRNGHLPKTNLDSYG